MRRMRRAESDEFFRGHFFIPLDRLLGNQMQPEQAILILRGFALASFLPFYPRAS
jgi:hypothetical protein